MEGRACESEQINTRTMNREVISSICDLFYMIYDSFTLTWSTQSFFTVLPFRSEPDHFDGLPPPLQPMVKALIPPIHSHSLTGSAPGRYHYRYYPYGRYDSYYTELWEGGKTEVFDSCGSTKVKLISAETQSGLGSQCFNTRTMVTAKGGDDGSDYSLPVGQTKIVQ